MRNRLQKNARIIIVLYSSVILLSLFENCGQVSIEAASVAPQEAPVAPLEVDNITFLKIDNSLTDIYRAVFVVDVSESMYSGPCPDSIDTWIPDVSPSINCLGPTGVDPTGNRFQVMLNWLDDLQTKIDSGILTNEKVKILVIPFSGPNSTYFTNNRWGIDYPVNPQVATPLGIPITKGFGTVTNARNYLYILWAIESKFHKIAMDTRIPVNIRNQVTAAAAIAALVGRQGGSTGTSTVATEFEKMNIELNKELNFLKVNDLLGKSHFEMVFFSDGVPKPHPLHIEAAAQYVWKRKKKVCDGNSLYPVNQNCENGYGNSEYGVAAVDGTKCLQRCADYLKTYADTGAVELPGYEKPTCSSYYSIPYMCSGYSDGSNFGTRWGSQIKCGQCFKLLEQYDWDATVPYYSFHQDNFKYKINQIWGDWTENRHANIIGKLKTTVNVFKIQHPGAAAWKMSFIRVDSANPLYATQTGEMKEEINWIVRAQKIFGKKHRFLILKSPAKPFELFQELQNGQTYKLGMLYVYNRNLRVNNAGLFMADSDGDGLLDLGETATTINTARSDGVCLDNIKNVYRQCISVGCNPSIDRDGDGLNQCEEITVGTDDFEADTDEDGILDGSELLYGLNPAADDQVMFTNTDGYSNFEHFVRCFPPTVNLDNIPAEKIIEITTNLVEYRDEKDIHGIDMKVPGYRIKVKNLPLISGITNEIVVVARVDNHSNPMDKRWVFKKYIINNPAEDKFEIHLEDFENLRMGAP